MPLTPDADPDARRVVHPRDTYLAVLRLLDGLTPQELHTLRVYDIPSEQRRRCGVRITSVPVGANAVNTVKG